MAAPLMAGVLSPGNSVGTLTVAGDLMLQDGSTYLYEIDANQNGDRVVVSGMAAIDDGAVFELNAEDGVFLDRVYPMIQSGTLDGTFENLHTNYTFIDLDFVTSDSGKELGVVAERNQTSRATNCCRHSCSGGFRGLGGWLLRITLQQNDCLASHETKTITNETIQTSGKPMRAIRSTVSALAGVLL